MNVADEPSRRFEQNNLPLTVSMKPAIESETLRRCFVSWARLKQASYSDSDSCASSGTNGGRASLDSSPRNFHGKTSRRHAASAATQPSRRERIVKHKSINVEGEDYAEAAPFGEGGMPLTTPNNETNESAQKAGRIISGNWQPRSLLSRPERDVAGESDNVSSANGSFQSLGKGARAENRSRTYRRHPLRYCRSLSPHDSACTDLRGDAAGIWKVWPSFTSLGSPCISSLGPPGTWCFQVPKDDLVWTCLMVDLMVRGYRHMATLVLLLSVTYCRPGKLVTFTPRLFNPPVRMICLSWSVTKCPRQIGRTDRRGIFDDTAILKGLRAWMDMLEMRKFQHPSAMYSVKQYTEAHFVHQFKAKVVELREWNRYPSLFRRLLEPSEKHLKLE